MARRLRSVPWAIALGLVLGGALGNLGDRLFRAPGPVPGARGRHDQRVRPVRPSTSRSSTSPTRRCSVGVVLAVLLELTGRQRDGSRVAAAETGRDAARHAGDGAEARPDAPAGPPLPAGARTASTGCGWTRPSPGCSGCPAPPPRPWSRPATRWSTASPGPSPTRSAAGAWLEVTLPAAGRGRRRGRRAGARPAVVYSDDDIVVVDKPVGVAAHPSPGWTGPTVIGGLAAMGHTIATSGAAERQGVVHRLDVGTTGLMVVAKSEQAYSVLKRAFKEREVDKRYHAVVQGHLDPLRGTIDAPIDRHPTHDYKWAVVSGGKPSITHYDTLEAFPAASLVDVQLETGRTHQIRVHFSALRHPCVGDLTYGADPTLAARLGLARQWLHARELGFVHPAHAGRGPLRQRLP